MALYAFKYFTNDVRIGLYNIHQSVSYFVNANFLRHVVHLVCLKSARDMLSTKKARQDAQELMDFGVDLHTQTELCGNDM